MINPEKEPAPLQQPFHREALTVRLPTNRGEAVARYHPVEETETRGGVIWVGGIGGGFNGPAGGLYPEMCHRFQQQGIAGLRIDYHNVANFEDCILDALVGTEFLAGNGIKKMVLVGHSFGGAVVITAGALSPWVKAVVPIATQTCGTELAQHLSPRALLLIHGTEDEILPDVCSRQIFRRAKEPKEMMLYEGAGHTLDEVRSEMIELLSRWIPEKLELY